MVVMFVVVLAVVMIWVVVVVTGVQRTPGLFVAGQHHPKPLKSKRGGRIGIVRARNGGGGGGGGYGGGGGGAYRGGDGETI